MVYFCFTITRGGFVMRRLFFGVLSGLVLAGGTALAEASLKIRCEFTKVKDGLYWTCKCNTCGTFGVTIAGGPENGDEWEIGAPTYKWTSNKGITFNPDDQEIVYYTLQPADFAQSHTITVTVTWTETHKITGATRPVEKTAELQLDAIILGEPTVETDNMDGRVLCDNRKGTLELSVLDASADTINVFRNNDMVKISSKPVKDLAHIINKEGTDIDFKKRPLGGNSIIWDFPKIYWYGVDNQPGGCCRGNNFGYEFTAKLENCNCVTNSFNAVYMPDDKPAIKTNEVNWEDNPSFVHNPTRNPIGNRWRCRIELHNFPKDGETVNVPTSDQYREETKEEEEFHLDQWYGIDGDGKKMDTEQGGGRNCWNRRSACLLACAR